MLESIAPYCAIGVTKFCNLRLSQSIYPLAIYDTIPSFFALFKFWQYEDGSHSREKRSIGGSDIMNFQSDLGSLFAICHLLIVDLSQWRTDRNLTSRCSQLRFNEIRTQLPLDNSVQNCLSTIKNVVRDYISLDQSVISYISPATPNRSAAVLAGNAVSASSQPDQCPLSEVTRTVNQICEHDCGHASYNDMFTLLHRNCIWNDDVNKKLFSVIDCCSNCPNFVAAPSNDKVSIGRIKHDLNHIVCTKHFWLNNLCLFHSLDWSNGLSTVNSVRSTVLSEGTVGFENTWAAKFWPPGRVQGNLSFRFDEIQYFLRQYETVFRRASRQPHHKHLLEPKYGVICLIFSRLISTFPSSNA